MEVSGRKAKTGNNREKFCHKCYTNGQRVMAIGYCQKSDKHLCEQCLSCHRKDKCSSHHVLESKALFIAIDRLSTCPTHSNEVTQFYCRAHEVLGCIVCMMSHKECEINYIQEHSKQFSESEEYLNLESCLEELKVRYSETMKKIKDNISQVERAHQIATDAVKTLKIEILECFNEFEKELQEEANTYKKTNEDEMTKLQDELDVLHRDIILTDSSIVKLKKEEKYNALFLETKRAAKSILDYQERMYKVSTRNCIKDMRFIPSTNLRSILKRENTFGRLEVVDKSIGPCNSAEYLESCKLGQISIKSETDRKACYATGLAFLSADQLAVADKANKNVKIVDVSYDKMISEITLSSSPRDITVIPPDQLAVTLRDEGRIQMLSTAKGLAKTGQIKTAGKCRGIKYDDGKLIVAFDSNVKPKIEILSLKGEVLDKFHMNKMGNALVNEPKCIGLSPDHNQIYVTDVKKMCVLRLSRFGIVTGIYERHKFVGVAVSTGGSVYASSKFGNTVLQLSDDLSTIKTVLTMGDGIKEPIALAVSNARNMLYVSCGCTDTDISNKLHVFKIKL